MAVSLMFPQLFDVFLFSNSVTQLSKMLSGVARIVRAISCVVRSEQSFAFSSRHWNPFSVLSGFCCCSTIFGSSVVESFVWLSANVNEIDSINKNVISVAPVFFMSLLGDCAL